MPPDSDKFDMPQDDDPAEARMRRALGLRSAGGGAPQQQRPDQARPKHRFAREGEVPVVVLNTRREHDGSSPSRDRIAALEASVASERAARSTAERALAESQGQAQALRTQLVHAEIAHREALAGAAARRQELEHALQEAITAREAAEASVRSLAPAADVPAPEDDPVDQAVKRRRRGSAISLVPKRKIARTADPKPVKWWLPSFRGPQER